MEIKTCEQYVLNRMEVLENDVESLKVDNGLKADKIAELESVIDRFRAFFDHHGRWNRAGDYLRFDLESLWQDYEQDRPEITELLSLLGPTRTREIVNIGVEEEEA